MTPVCYWSMNNHLSGVGSFRDTFFFQFSVTQDLLTYLLEAEKKIVFKSCSSLVSVPGSLNT